ncbi:DUF2141 domain-containing protein [Sphingorhabdus sp. IMCC26285]|uniref:DUF2141 domain-containing protein n=2 Tax=Sphingorhabdus profundilacus TaxID=2509718 RepID=A0A6I4M0J3_9SPHN|nr:DUF2141 domain-containing protein [Sphingorhabdus profundilacus]
MMNKFVAIFTISTFIFGAGTAVAGQEINNDMSRCTAGNGPAILINVRGVKESAGKVRVQSYPATNSAWLAKGRWLHRIESRANAGNMTFCVPVPAEGRYGIAVRHDRNGNGQTDISKDGGGFSNNPSISILNLGKPSFSKVAFQAGPGVTKITINLKYL